MALAADNLERTERLSLLGQSWRLPQPMGRRPATDEALGLPAWAQALLSSRGIAEPQQLRSYLQPSLADLEDPAHMAGMDAAVDRLLQAVRQQQRVVIYGDYDVDGVVSSAVMVEFLRLLHVPVDYYIPDRRAEGYGLNAAAIAQLCDRAQLIVTVDCGITAYDEVEVARLRGVDVLVVDHHQVPAVLPRAVACLNPHRPDCSYAFKGLCAAGVAFMLVIALRRALREAGHFGSAAQPDVRGLLDMVAVATVADMVPLCEANRVLVAAGLRRLATAPRPGLQALCEVAQVDPQRISAADLGFRLGPRINARGRMSQAGAAVELMLTDSLEQARTLAATLDAANLERRSVERHTVEQALQQVLEQGLQQDAALVVHHPSWHPGILGLVASRLAVRYRRPALVIGEGGKGSARSVEGFDLHAALTQVSAHLERFGGHRAAAGVTVQEAQIDPLRTALTKHVQSLRGSPPYAAILQADALLQAHTLNETTLGWLQRLGPFGQGNPEPLFVADRLQVVDKRVVGRSHLKLRLQGGAEAIGFDMAHLAEKVAGQVDAAFCLELNVFSGRRTMQLRLRDLRPSN